MTDAQLATFLNVSIGDVMVLSPAKRATFERMARTVDDLNQWQRGEGPRPAGVLVDHARVSRRKVRRGVMQEPSGYPENDTHFEDKTIERVSHESDGTFAITCDGWTLWCGKDCPVEPKEGEIARQYGRGIGSSVRGLFIDGVKVWYRTEDDDREHQDILSYGADAADWLSRWDAGKCCWSIEMGGLGPGYEQCIQITAAEVLRWLLEQKQNASCWQDGEVWREVRGQLEKALFELPAIKSLGLSGAQWGAAVSLATKLYMDGPRKIMADERVKDRKIQVCRVFPGIAA